MKYRKSIEVTVTYTVEGMTPKDLQEAVRDTLKDVKNQCFAETKNGGAHSKMRVSKPVVRPLPPPEKTKVKHTVLGCGLVTCAGDHYVSIKFDDGVIRHLVWALSQDNLKILK